MRHVCAFLLLGALLFVAKRGFEHVQASAQRLIVSVPKSASEQEVERAINQALLTDLALSGPAVRADPVVRDQLLRAVSNADESASEGELVQRALELGIQRVDPVVRERLAFQGEQMLRAALPLPEPSDAELERYLRAHEPRYVQPERVSLTQVFVSRSLRGARVDAEAAALKQKCEHDETAKLHPARFSDPTILPLRVDGASAADIDARFGPGVAERVLASAPGVWSGPIASPYGLHLVFVHAREPRRTPALSEIRARVRSDFLYDRAKSALDRELARLRKTYVIDVQRVEG
jgi:hypothetical protein